MRRLVFAAPSLPVLVFSLIGCTSGNNSPALKEPLAPDKAAPAAGQQAAENGGAVSKPAAPAETPPEVTKPQAAPAETPPEVTKPQAARSESAPLPSAAEALANLDESCRKQLMEIRRLENGIPRIFLDLKRSPDELEVDMQRGIQIGQSFLEKCPSGPIAAEVRGLVARWHLARYERHRQAVRKMVSAKQITADQQTAELEGYLANVFKLASEAANTPSDNRAVRAEALRILLEVSERQRKFDDLRKYSAVLMKEFPSYDLIRNVIFSTGRSYISEGKYREARDYVRSIIEAHADDEEFVMYNIVLFQGMSGMGDLEGIEGLMEEILVEYPLRSQSVSKPYLKQQYEQWANVAKFWIGFSRYALGDIDGARSAFEEHRAETESLIAALSTRGEKPDPVVNITLEYRTKDLLKFLDEFQGNVPSVDMEFGEYWATDTRMSLKESRGSVVVIVFRKPGDPRSFTFMREAGELYGEHKDKGIKVAMVSYLLGKPDAAKDKAKLAAIRGDVEKLGFDIPAGCDPDRKHSFFHALHGTVGTASCVVLDREGKMAYFMADPRDMDRMILRSVVERLLKS